MEIVFFFLFSIGVNSCFEVRCFIGVYAWVRVLLRPPLDLFPWRIHEGVIWWRRPATVQAILATVTTNSSKVDKLGLNSCRTNAMTLHRCPNPFCKLHEIPRSLVNRDMQSCDIEVFTKNPNMQIMNLNDTRQRSNIITNLISINRLREPLATKLLRYAYTMERLKR